MNIKQAKEQIKKTVRLYFSKDSLGNYDLEAAKQRPVFLMGPPGIGKTAIVQQVAAELKVGFVSYSMTHHTRQSALGLPFIAEREFQGKQYHIAEYTMSEIIASVYKEMEQTGCTEGILFLDEMNCVSETLSPAMLQFLQYKTFGTHKVPEGWLVVAAGNPAEYNNSVREFDLATWDRLKRMDVEPDFAAWKEYAKEQEVHPAVLTFLELHPDYFYHIERTVDGRDFVTARGWEDLSSMLHLYEKNNVETDEVLFGQYLQYPKLAEEFAVYYELYRKYQSDYQIGQILAGKAPEAIYDRAKDALQDERIALAGMIGSAVKKEAAHVMMAEQALLVLRDWLREMKENMPVQNVLQKFQDTIAEKTENYKENVHSGNIGKQERKQEEYTLLFFKETVSEAWKAINEAERNTPEQNFAGQNGTEQDEFELFKSVYSRKVAEMQEEAKAFGKSMEHALSFTDNVFGEKTELLLLLSELTHDYACSRFLARHGNDAYYHYSRELMLDERLEQLRSIVDIGAF
ncbi:MAG: AAA family ATPase [Eubacterium sp.]|nr:AAA family ATPase [Eubacterium sp.]